MESLLENWYRRMREAQFSHYEAARSFDRMHYLLGVPSVVLSTLIGTSIFATLGESINSNLRLLTGLTSVLVAALTALQTFLKFSEKSEKHRLVAARYGSLRREVEQLLTQKESLTKELVTPLREAIDRLSEESPSIPTRAWSKTKKKLSSNHSIFLNSGEKT